MSGQNTTESAITTDTNASAAGTTPAPTDTPTTGGDAAGATDTPGTDASGDEWANFDAERAKQTIEKLRRIEKEMESKLAAERRKVEEFERAQMTEIEKAKADLEAAQREAAEARKQAADIAQRQAFESAALKAGVNPKAMAAARALAADVATTDESGTMSVDDALFEALKADHSYLFTAQQAGPPQVTFGAAASQGPGASPTSLTPQQVAFAQKAGIAPEDFAKHAARK